MENIKKIAPEINFNNPPLYNKKEIKNILPHRTPFLFIDEIREMEDYQNVKKGCNTNNPTLHCKNCSYKELPPIIYELSIFLRLS